MYYKSVFSVFTFIFILMLTIAHPVQCDKRMIVVADEGAVTHWFLFPGDTLEEKLDFIDDRWRHYKLTIKVDQAIGNTTILGKVQHSYGAGPFQEEIIGNAYINDASITSFADHISFRISLAEDVPSTLTDLISIKPVPNIDINRLDTEPIQNGYHYNTHRDGAGELPLQWKSIVVTDEENHMIEIDPRISQEETIGHVFETMRIRTSGFESEVIYVGVYEIQHRTGLTGNKHAVYYFPFEKIDDNLYKRSFFTRSFHSDRPITIEVRLENGECYLITTNEVAEIVTITPTTAVKQWFDY